MSVQKERNPVLDYKILEKSLRELTQQIASNQLTTITNVKESIQKLEIESDPSILLVVLRVMCSTENISTDIWQDEDSLYEKMNLVYWGDQSWVEDDDPHVSKLFMIGQILFLLDIIDLEDFRPLIRFYYHKVEEPNDSRHEITRTLLQKALQKGLQDEEIIHSVRDAYEFLGVLIPSPTEIIMDATELGIESLDSYIEKNRFCQFLRLVEDRIQYLPELIVGRNFNEINSEAHLWLSHSMMTRIMNEFLDRALIFLKEKVNQDQVSLQDVRKLIKPIFKDVGLTDSAQEPLPITYEATLRHIGPQLKPAAPLNPSRFELIPKESINHLLGRLSFASPVTKVEIIFMGGGGIGRSGILVVTNNGSVLLDFGYSVTNTQIPRFVPELRFLDAVLLSHAHLDHSGGLPILYRESGYHGPWYGAPFTRELTRMLLANSSELLKMRFRKSFNRRHPIYKHITNPSNLARVHQNFVPLEPGKQVEIAPEVLVTPFRAGHIYGSMSYLLDIAGHTILYTGDFNLNSTSLFPTPIDSNFPLDADYTIFDGTYFGAPPFDYENADQILRDIVQNNDRVLIPAFSLGRSQELLQRLENLELTKNKHVILLGMSARIARLAGLKGNYELHEKGIPSFDPDTIIIAGSGMLSGKSPAAVLFHEIRQDPTSAVVLCGWMANKTLGWDLLQGNVSHQCQLAYARMSAHTSSDKLDWFIDQLTGKKIMAHSPGNISNKNHSELILPNYESRIRVA